MISFQNQADQNTVKFSDAKGYIYGELEQSSQISQCVECSGKVLRYKLAVSLNNQAELGLTPTLGSAKLGLCRVSGSISLSVILESVSYVKSRLGSTRLIHGLRYQV